MKGMPEFETEEEFNKFFEKETAYCNQFRDETGMMSLGNFLTHCLR